MTPRAIFTVAALACMLSGGAAAEDSKAKGASLPRLADDGLDQERAFVDRRLATRLANLHAERVRLQAFHERSERERSEFERYMAEEQKAFLTYLKAVRPEEREAAWKDFESRQDSKRKEFDKRLYASHERWFDEAITKRRRSEPLGVEALAALEQVPEIAATPQPQEETPVKPKKKKK